MTHPFRRRGDGWSSPHERARARAAERLDTPLDPEENDWLERHLAECVGCSSLADSYQADRSELRALRRQTMTPPRDLWARTAAAIEREAGAGAPVPRTPLLRRARPGAMPLGAVAGLMVVAVVFGATLLSGRPVPTVAPNATPVDAALVPTATVQSTPGPTPWPYDGNVDYMAFGDGTVTIYNSQISEVCPDNGSACAPLDATPQAEVVVENEPEEAILSDDGTSIVFVDNASDGTGTVVVVPVPTPTGSAGPTVAPSVEPTPTPTVTASAVTPSESPGQSGEPASTPPSAPPSPPAESPAPPTPTPSVEPADGSVAIADDVVLVGAADFNEDGTTFAFSARPADGSAGPDIYVWNAGDPEATPITSDQRSVFSGWVDGLVVGSRPVDAAAAEGPAESFVIDPATGATSLAGPEGAWRPVVDPGGESAVWWDGSIALDATGTEWKPADGRLVVGPWPGLPDLVEEPAASVEPGSSAEPTTSAEPTSPLPSPVDADELTVVVDGVIADWQARWDGAAEHLAIWIADTDDPTIGRLSLYGVDDGAVVDEPLLANEWALPGFAMTADHLAWATRQNGESTLVKVVAWTEDGIGQVETKPGEDVLIVQR